MLMFHPAKILCQSAINSSKLMSTPSAIFLVCGSSVSFSDHPKPGNETGYFITRTTRVKSLTMERGHKRRPTSSSTSISKSLARMSLTIRMLYFARAL